LRSVTPLFLASAVIVSACGGSTTSNSNVQLVNTKAQADIFPFTQEVVDFDATELASSPAESSASMSGVFYVSADETSNEGVAGEINMSANFAANTVSGTMNNFVEVDDIVGDDNETLVGRDMSGEISYSGTINIGPNIGDDITASGSGTVRNSSGTDFSVTAEMAGDFFRRPNSDLGAFGELEATATDGTTSEVLDGFFAVTE